MAQGTPATWSCFFQGRMARRFRAVEAPGSMPDLTCRRAGSSGTTYDLKISVSFESTCMSRTAPASNAPATALTHLQRLEGESIHIMREVVAECARPVMLYSIGKDSAVMLHLARKAFYPALPPFPLLHVDTTWKFRAMYEFRDAVARESGMQLIVHQNPDAKARGINPFDHGSALHTDLWKTEGLKQALDLYGFDAAFGGARRDEEKSR